MEKNSCQKTGVMAVTQTIPFRSVNEYVTYQRGSNKMSLPDVTWYWEEDQNTVQKHATGMRLENTNFVSYGNDISKQIERAFQQYKKDGTVHSFPLDLSNKVVKKRNVHTGASYTVNFARMIQTNHSSQYDRSIHREEVMVIVDFGCANQIPALPNDIDDNHNNLLPIVPGQIIEVTKEHPTNNEWAYGEILYDPFKLRAGTINALPTASAFRAPNETLSQSLQTCATSGWFPITAVSAPTVDVMGDIIKGMKGMAVSSETPPTWERFSNDKQSFNDGRFPLCHHSKEWKEVVSFVQHAPCTSSGQSINIASIERIQNLALWQIYAAKKQTMEIAFEEHPETVVNNHSRSVERKWLFHGTTKENAAKIERQGFNRSFAGRNGAQHGKGVYFARDLSTSTNHTYSVPDDDNVQRMFMCRVAIGDFCQGTSNQLIPDTKPNQQTELFDSTVDSVDNPSTFVVYHDAQAYPEYLITFTR